MQHDISVDALRKVIDTKPDSINEPMRSKAAHAVKAIETGTPRIHLLDGRELDGLLNEIFSNEGVGTLIYGNEYQQIRQATKRDVRAIYNLTRSGMKREELLRPHPAGHREKHRPVLRLRNRREHHRLRLAACLRRQSDDGRDRLALRHAVLPPPRHRQEDGRVRLPDGEGARRQDRHRALDPSLQFLHLRLRFSEAEKEVLPESRLKTYEESGRNSKILVKQL